MALTVAKLASLVDSSTVVEKANSRYGDLLKSTSTAIVAFARLDNGAEHEQGRLFNEQFRPLIAAACADDALTLANWNSILTATLGATAEGIGEAKSHAKSYVKLLISTARNAPFILKSKYATAFYEQQAHYATELAASSEEKMRKRAAKVKYTAPLNVAEASHQDLRAVMSGANKAERNPIEAECAALVAELARKARNFAKAGKFTAETRDTLQKLLGMVPAPETESGAPETESGAPETVITDTVQQIESVSAPVQRNVA